MIQVTVVPNALEPERHSVHRVPELLPWLAERYRPHWPATARLSHLFGKVEVDVTPATKADIESLTGLPGPFFVREYPAGLETVIAVGVTVLVAAVAAVLLIPDVPNVRVAALRSDGGRSGSPNNQLGERANVARPEQRIPDMYGTNRAIPDLLMQPYTIYVDHRARELAYYCLGEGGYSYTAIRDGAQLIGGIPDASAEVYPPGKAPTGGIGLHDPDTTIGDPIEDDVYTVYRVEAVNGQQLFSFSDYTFYGSAFRPDATIASINEIEYLGAGVGLISFPFSANAEEITDRLEIGDELNIYWPTAFLGGGAPDLTTPMVSTPPEPLEIDGVTVTAITPDTFRVDVEVSIPAGQQAQWAAIAGFFGTPSPAFLHMQCTALSHVHEGPFFIDFEHPLGSTDFEVVCNFVAPQGSYQDDGTTALPLNKKILVYLTPASSGGSPTGASEVFEAILEGSVFAKGSRALTIRCKPVGALFATSTRCLVRARLLTNGPRRERQDDNVERDIFGFILGGTPVYYSGRVVDEIRWVDCYSMSKPPQVSFGDVTTIHTMTVATEGAARVKSRKLSLIATRLIQTWNGATFGGPLIPSEFAENTLFTILKDPRIGNLPDAAIDFPGIAAAFQAVRDSVFDTSPLSTIFAHTFDEADTSLEETIAVICQACFCTAFRRGPVISVRPELATDDDALVLNHRNISRGSQRITHTFGQPTENDSIECAFVDPFADVQDKVTVPLFGANLRPRRLNVVGIRTERQAYWHAYRALHKMLHQRLSVAVEVAEEAGTVGVRERVLMADLTRSSGAQDGEVFSASGTTIRTSQPVALTPGKTYTLYLQAPDRTVQAIAVTASPNQYQLTLTSAPSPSPITDAANGVRTLYMLIADDDATPRAYLVSSTQPNPGLTHDVNLVNYSHIYYLADGLQTYVRFANGLADQSPMRRQFTNSGGSLGGGLWTGVGLSYFEITPGTASDIATESYTKFLRINASAPTDSRLIESGNDTSELFAIDAGSVLRGGHGGVLSVSFNYASLIGTEHTVALSYDAVTQRMALLVDGILRDSDTVAPSALTGATRYLEGFAGTCREIYRWGRALSDREIMEIHLRTRP